MTTTNVNNPEQLNAENTRLRNALDRTRSSAVFDILKRAEQFARDHDDIKLANKLYGLGCMLGGPTEMPPFKLTPEHAAAVAAMARKFWKVTKGWHAGVNIDWSAVDRPESQQEVYEIYVPNAFQNSTYDFVDVWVNECDDRGWLRFERVKRSEYVADKES